MREYLLGLLGLCGLCFLTGCGGAPGSTSPTTEPLAITSAAPPSGTTGSAYAGNGFFLTASGGVAPYIWGWAPATGSALPPGLTLSNAMISGTPTAPNTYNVVITVTDSQFPAVKKSTPYAIKVTAGALVITSGAPPAGTVGIGYSSGGFSLTASGGAAPYSWSWAPAAGSFLPPGLTLTNGVISGTPTTVNTYNVVITVADSQTPPAQTPANYTITVNAQSPLVVTSGPLPPGRVGSIYANFGFPLSASGGVQPYRWSWTAAPGSSLPPGLSLTVGPRFYCQVSGWAICGKPTTGGVYGVVITVTDSASPPNHTSQTHSIMIIAGPPTITTVSVSVGTINVPYNFMFSATGGYPPYTWSETGALPSGLNLASDGTLSGTPTVTGSFPIAVSVADSHSQSATPANFTVQIAAHGFKATGSMATARSLHTATLLQDGRVLVAGGWDNSSNGPLASAELYDPIAGSFSPANSMATPRADYAATLLKDGRVLLVGGFGVSSAEVYDPNNGNFVAVGGMQVDRVEHTATLLQDGRVLVVGGMQKDGTVLASAEIFDPATNSFTPTGQMSTARVSHTATLLTDGRVLVTGGSGGTTNLASAELYNPATGKFTSTGNMSSPRNGHTATLLGTNKVVVIAGRDATGSNVLNAELYDPFTGNFSAVGQLVVGIWEHTATLLSNGQLLVAGGQQGSGSDVSTAEIFDPATNSFSLTGSMISPRSGHTATPLNDGTVLVTGGGNGANTAELYQ